VLTSIYKLWFIATILKIINNIRNKFNPNTEDISNNMSERDLGFFPIATLAVILTAMYSAVKRYPLDFAEGQQ